MHNCVKSATKGTRLANYQNSLEYLVLLQDNKLDCYELVPEVAEMKRQEEDHLEWLLMQKILYQVK